MSIVSSVRRLTSITAATAGAWSAGRVRERRALPRSVPPYELSAWRVRKSARAYLSALRCSCLLLLCRQFFRGERRPARKSDHVAIRAEIDSRTSNLAPEDRLQGRRQLLCEGVPRPPTNFRRCILRAVEKDWPAGVADVERQFVLIGMTHSRDAEGRPGVSTRPWLFGSCDLRLKIYGSTRSSPFASASHCSSAAPFSSQVRSAHIVPGIFWILLDKKGDAVTQKVLVWVVPLPFGNGFLANRLRNPPAHQPRRNR